MMGNRLSMEVLEHVIGGAGNASIEDSLLDTVVDGSTEISGSNNFPFACRNGCTNTFYIDLNTRLVRCPHCGMIHTLNG